MTNRVPRKFRDTKKVMSTRWSAKELYIPAWAVNAIIYITVIRSFVYGIELVLSGTSSLVNPLLGFVAIMGIQTWGLLMVGSILVLLVGLWTRNLVTVIVGTLLCAAVWVGFALILGLGLLVVGDGIRFVVAAACNALTWSVFFIMLLKTLKNNRAEV